jgi:PadR family transcriptional regulator, regulatory protein PadR
MAPNVQRDEIPPGTLDMLILKTLAPGTEMHGFAIAEAIQQKSSKVLQVEEGSLYPALQRMLIKGWIVGEWSKTDQNRRARYYRLTKNGRKQLEQEMATYRRVAQAISLILNPA